MPTYYFACGGTCNGPVEVPAGNVNEALLLAQAECGCDGCCQLLGSDDAESQESTDMTPAQKAFIPTPEFLQTARRISPKT